MLTYLIFFVLAGYILLMVVALAGLSRAFSEREVCGHDFYPGRITVVVPFRNEVATLPKLIGDLLLQDDKDFEVILVDDHSDDGSMEMVNAMIGSHSHFRYLKSDGQGKKAALTTGIHAATGSLILTTDADCRSGRKWISVYRRAFADENIMMAFGLVRTSENGGRFASLQSQEFMSVIGAGVAAFGLGKPLYCNGANLAFRKSAFTEVGGYNSHKNIASGDDEFLLKEMATYFPGAIRFVREADALITTQPLRTVGAFVQQRVRWAGKWRKTPGWISKLVAPMMVLVQLAVLGGVCLAAIEPGGRAVLVFLLASKAGMEYLVVLTVAQAVSLRARYIDFVILQLLYPFYVLTIALLSTRGFAWKARRYSPSGALPG